MSSEFEVCAYCEKPVEKGMVEQDHLPIPKRHGGTQTVPACRVCHTLKDRMGLDNMQVFTYMMAEWKSWPPSARVLLAKLAGLAQDYAAKAQESAAKLHEYAKEKGEA